LSSGELASAAEHLRRAKQIDPMNRSTNSLLLDIETSLEISRELSRRSGAVRDPGHWRRPDDPERLHTEFVPAERRRAEQRLIEEQLRRDQLIAVVTVLDDSDLGTPGPILGALRPSQIANPDTVGPRLARSLSDEEIEVRTLYGPVGEVVARYYFSRDSQQLLLREADDDMDGRPDRWIGYSDSVRSQIWRDEEGATTPRMHMTYAGGGGPLETLEIDDDRDGTAEQVYRYRDGLIDLAAHDTMGDGHHDRFDHFDRAGGLVLREEDLDGDGQFDVRTHYREGRLLSREILSPEAYDAAESRKAMDGIDKRAIGVSLIPASRTRQ
jgi:hypothetical protein